MTHPHNYPASIPPHLCPSTCSLCSSCCVLVCLCVQLKLHPFFADIDWTLLAEKKVPPPFKPNVQRITDTDNFDVEFTSMPLHSHEANKQHTPAQPQPQQHSGSHSGQQQQLDQSSTDSAHMADGSGSEFGVVEGAAGVVSALSGAGEDEEEDEGADGDAGDSGQFANFTFVSHDFL